MTKLKHYQKIEEYLPLGKRLPLKKTIFQCHVMSYESRRNNRPITNVVMPHQLGNVSSFNNNYC